MANELARAMRRRPTPAEQTLWTQLRLKRAQGLHFRRQAPIGPYIVDFVCHRIKLIVEVDGGQHGEDDVVRRDALRTEWLEERGYRVLRFWNEDVLSDLASVIDTIDIELFELKHLASRDHRRSISDE